MIYSTLAFNLPPELSPIVEQISYLANDLRWTWSHGADALWKKIDPITWEQTENPYAVIQNLTKERLEELAGDKKFVEQLQQFASEHEEYCNCPGWYAEEHPSFKLNTIAYFSMEYGLGEALPLYAGGLGMLAGDHLKAASDLGLPLVAIGLLYQEGYFRQMLDADGWQRELYPVNDTNSLPITPVQASSGAWLHVTLEFPGRDVRLRVWQVRIGRVILYLLDSNDPINNALDRGITGKLYAKGQEQRLMQEIALGIGGWRVLEALGIQVDVCHLNEGHAAFVTLERARSFMQKHQCEFWEAMWATRSGNVFTTHTPVLAGFDRFAPELVRKYGEQYAKTLGIHPGEIAILGRKNSHSHDEPFNMAYLAMRTCVSVNGVSQLHGETSRKIFQELFPRWPEREVPVTHITNGVHVPSWDSRWADKIWTKACGKSRWRGTTETITREIEQLSDEALWTFSSEERADLVNHARRRLKQQLGQRNVSSEEIEQASNVLDPNVLTLGFARRFTEYKRPNLLLHDPSRLQRLLTNPHRPVQIIVAGKAHPEDEPGKKFIQQWAQFVTNPEVRANAVFLEDYDISLAQEMVQGVDVWINTPRRPWEACGTSGMKVLVNGGLNVSSLDGWWAEAYTPEVGWALGDGLQYSDSDRDAIEANELYRLLEEEIIPCFYQRDTTGLPREWVAKVRASMSQLAPQFSTNRMVSDYLEKIYLPTAEQYQRRVKEGVFAGQQLRQWNHQLHQHWHEVHLGNLTISKTPDGWKFELQVYLAEISAESVQVQLFAENTQELSAASLVMQQSSSIAGALNGFVYQAEIATDRHYTDFTPRIVAYHPEACTPIECNLIQWWTGQAELVT